MTHTSCAGSPDTMDRWCATQVDSAGEVTDWGWCSDSCYAHHLLNGTEFCGNHSSCSNSDDQTYGVSCSCDPGYTEHTINSGERQFILLHTGLPRL